MKKEIILRCFAQKVDGRWQAFCLDLTLAAESDTLEAACNKLQEQIAHYVHDAVEGPDKAFSKQLLNRRAPLRYWLRYYLIKSRMMLQRIHNQTARTMRLPLPLNPNLLA